MQILEFIKPTINDYSMPVLKELLICLSPIGDLFFDLYIYGKYEGIQFISVVDRFTEVSAHKSPKFI